MDIVKSYQVRVSCYRPSFFKNMDKILKSFLENHFNVDSYKLKGPIPFPKKEKFFSVNRSHHVNKKSQDQFVWTQYSRMWLVHFYVSDESNKWLEGFQYFLDNESFQDNGAFISWSVIEYKNI